MTARVKPLLHSLGKLSLERRIFLFCTTSSFFAFFVFLNSQHCPPRIVWDSHVVKACQERSCFLRTPVTDNVSPSRAHAALKYLEEYSKTPPIIPVPQLLLQNSIRSQCSVVGGAPASGHPSHRKIIDATTTIRLNVRHPHFLRAEGISPRLGTRTDVLLIQRGALRKFEQYINGWGQGNVTLGRLRFMAGESLIKDKPLLLYRTECPTNLQACVEALEALNISTTPTRLPLWIIHHDMEVMARATLARFGMRRRAVPSTGITGILIALHICERVNIFAMSGSTKGDGDFVRLSVWNGHNLDSERRFVRWLSTCSNLQHPWCGRVKVFS